MTTPWALAFLLLCGAAILLAVLTLRVLWRLAPLIDHAEAVLSATARGLVIGGLAPGTPIPAFRTEQVDGSVFTDANLRETESVVLFLDANCSACDLLVDDLERAVNPTTGTRLVVVTADRDVALRLARSTEVVVLIDHDKALAGAFESVVAPHAFAVDRRGTVIASGTPNHWDELIGLIAAPKGGGSEPELAAAAVAT